MSNFLKIPLLALVLVASGVGAVRGDTGDLYIGKAAVSSQDASERRKALPLALLQVLQKLSGLRDFDEYPLLGESLSDAEKWLVSFYYENRSRTLSDGSVRDGLMLVARFSENGINELVRTMQLPLWKPERPATEIWVVLDNGMNRQIFPLEYQYIWDDMDAAAYDRGLPISWPVADEDGQYPVNDQILWGGYTEDLVGAGRGGVMVAAARREGAEWSARINLTYRDQSWTWRNRDLDLQFLLTESIQQTADLVASADQIAASDRAASRYTLTVTGVGAADDYASCLAYLQSLSVVDRVYVHSATAAQVRFDLELNALPTYLEDMIAAGRVLRPGDEAGLYHFGR